MRIALLTTEYPPHWGGLGASVWHEARELARRGHDVHVVRRAGRGAVPIDGVTAHEAPMAPVPAYYAVSFARRAVPAALALDPDVVHVASPCVLPTSREWDALDAAGVGTAVTFHGSWLGERLALRASGGLTPNDLGILAVARLLEPLERLAMRRARSAITVSAFAKRELALYDAEAAERVAIVPNGVDAERFAGDGPAGSRGVVAVGRLSGRKNLATLVDAVAKLDRKVARVTLVGRDGGLRRALERRAARLGVALAVRESADEAALLAALRDADVFALPSRYEAQGIAYLEAMACRLPCVGGDVGGVPEVIDDGETGALVPPDDARALADALARYLDDAPLARRHGEAGRKKAESLDWRRVGVALERRLKEAAA